MDRDVLELRQIRNILLNAGIANPTGLPDSAAVDAFGRLRMATPYTIFDSKQIADNLPLFYDDAEVSGGGTTSTYSAAHASSTLAVTANTAGRRVRQTKQRFNYQPGKSMLIVLTGVLGSGVSGVTKRRGYYDDNNGLFFQLTGSALSVVIRSSYTGTPVDSIITQANWNLDPLDGHGVSGITLDLTKAQIFFIDFEWLGVGRVRFGFYIDGLPHVCHEVLTANLGSGVYMSTPNLPIRTEIINDGTGAAATLEEICSTVISEGGIEQNGVIRYTDRGVTPFQTGNNQNLHPILSLRLKTAYLSATVLPLSVAMLVTSNADHRWSLLLNPTIGGTDQASWQDVPNSAVQVDISRNNTNTLTGGIAVFGGLSADTLDVLNVVTMTALTLGARINGTRDELVLAFQRLAGAGDEAVYGGLNWREII